LNIDRRRCGNIGKDGRRMLWPNDDGASCHLPTIFVVRRVWIQLGPLGRTQHVAF